MVVLLCLWRILMDYSIAPRVMGHELEIHPLLALFTLMVGGSIGRIVGIYLSVPLVATLRIIYRRRISRSAPDTTLLSESGREPRGRKTIGFLHWWGGNVSKGMAAL